MKIDNIMSAAGTGAMLRIENDFVIFYVIGASD